MGTQVESFGYEILYRAEHVFAGSSNLSVVLADARKLSQHHDHPGLVSVRHVTLEAGRMVSRPVVGFIRGKVVLGTPALRHRTRTLLGDRWPDEPRGPLSGACFTAEVRCA